MILLRQGRIRSYIHESVIQHFLIILWLHPSVLYQTRLHPSPAFAFSSLFTTTGGFDKVYDHFLFFYYFSLVDIHHLFFLWLLSVAVPKASRKSVTTTLASPSFFTHLLTDLTTRSSLRSRACKWSSVKMGLSGSRAKDSLITSLRRYSGCINSCSLSSVERLILKENDTTRMIRLKLFLECLHVLLNFIFFFSGWTTFLERVLQLLQVIIFDKFIF